MNVDPQRGDSAFERINHELHVRAQHDRADGAPRSSAALAVTDLCRTYRAVRPDLERATEWLEKNAAEALELFRLLTRIADNACKVSAPDRWI